MKSQAFRRFGFTLLEVMLVVTLIGIIAAIVISRVSQSSELAKTKACFHNRMGLNAAIERWYVEHDVWPAADLSDIGADINYFPAGLPVCPVTGNGYSMNASTHRVIGHASSAAPGDH